MTRDDNDQEALERVPDGPLWDDNPAALDLLGFAALVRPVVAALSDKNLDPVTIGLQAPWGGGKSTLLRLLADELGGRERVLVIEVTPWEFDDAADVKGTLIGEILKALEADLAASSTVPEKVARRIKSLMSRISWARVGIAMGRGALTMAWNPDEIIQAFTPDREEPIDLAGFRDQFAELMSEIEGLDRVVVLVDDLDRCLPEAVVQTLEAIKLFLSVPKMAFVIAADRTHIRGAVASHLPDKERGDDFAGPYLQKIIQIPITVPRLAPQDAAAYIGLLFAAAHADAEILRRLVAHCEERRAKNLSPLLDEIPGDIGYEPDQAQVRLVAQIAHGLSSDKLGSPREIKRFLNDLTIRRSIAMSRGIGLSVEALVKLILLEERYPKALERLLKEDDELAQQALLASWESWASSKNGAAAPEEEFKGTEQWASSEPSLKDEALGPYLTLAASLSESQPVVALGGDLASLVSELAGGHGDVRMRAAVQALGEKTEEDQRRVIKALDDRLRRSDEQDVVIQALVEVADTRSNLEEGVAATLRSVDRARLSPASAVRIAGSKSERLRGVAKDLASDEKVRESTRRSLDEMLESGGPGD